MKDSFADIEEIYEEKEEILEEEESWSSRRPSVDSSPRKQPCSFFISTSPPLPSMTNACLPSEVSSISGESKAKSSSDTDEGVVLVMDKELSPAEMIPPPAPTKLRRSSKSTLGNSRRRHSELFCLFPEHEKHLNTSLLGMKFFLILFLKKRDFSLFSKHEENRWPKSA